jgi:hypothetical protein
MRAALIDGPSFARWSTFRSPVITAMTAGVSDKLWEVSDIAALVEAAEAKLAKRGAYKKREAA